MYAGGAAVRRLGSRANSDPNAAAELSQREPAESAAERAAATAATHPDEARLSGRESADAGNDATAEPEAVDEQRRRAEGATPAHAGGEPAPERRGAFRERRPGHADRHGTDGGRSRRRQAHGRGGVGRKQSGR